MLGRPVGIPLWERGSGAKQWTLPCKEGIPCEDALLRPSDQFRIPRSKCRELFNNCWFWVFFSCYFFYTVTYFGCLFFKLLFFFFLFISILMNEKGKRKQVIPKTLKMVFDTSLLNTPGKGVTPSPTPSCSSYWKGSLLVALDYGRQLYFTN